MLATAGLAADKAERVPRDAVEAGLRCCLELLSYELFQHVDEHVEVRAIGAADCQQIRAVGGRRWI